MSLPLWKCHKVVQAAKIQTVLYVGEVVELLIEDRLFRMTHAWAKKHEPQVGGYLVIYEDGYQSYSPAKAFEDGYTRIEEQS